MALDVTGSYRYPAPRAAWLEKTVEDILEPELPIIDPHHHIWTQDGNPYLLDDLESDLDTGHSIVATVFVQAHYGYRNVGPESLKPVGETEQIVQMDKSQSRIQTDSCAGIVGFADLTMGSDVAPVLEAHLAVAPTRFKGVRHSVSRDENFPDGIVLRPAPAGLLADKNYREGLSLLAEYGLSYDAMLYHRQISELTAMAKKVPQLSVVLDHFGCILGVGPYRGTEHATFKEWQHDIKALAECSNVSIKLGGMGMIICGATYHERGAPPGSYELAEAWRPYVETCIEHFGVERCMFESNFPVDKAMFSYPILWNAFKRITSGASPKEKSALFHDTAADFYRLPR